MSFLPDAEPSTFLVIDSSNGSRLAVVTAAPAGAVKGSDSASAVKGSQWQLDTLAETINDNPRAHAEHLTPGIRQTLRRADIDLAELSAIIVTSGPAPYTGLRAGLITARTLGFARGIEVYGVSTLDTVARQLLDAADSAASEEDGTPQTVIAVLDAKRREVYAQACQALGADDVRITREPVAAPAEEIAHWASEQMAAVGGIGVSLYPEAFTGIRIINDATVPEAHACVRIALARLARRAAGENVDLSVEPRYLRRPDVHMPNQARR